MTEEKIKKIRLNVMLDEERFDKLTEFAEKTYTDKSKLIRKWIDEHIDENIIEKSLHK